MILDLAVIQLCIELLTSNNPNGLNVAYHFSSEIITRICPSVILQVNNRYCSFLFFSKNNTPITMFFFYLKNVRINSMSLFFDLVYC